MQTLQIEISNYDFKKYNLRKEIVKFSDLVELIKEEYAKKALLECNEIAKNTGLSELTIEEINAEINFVRDAKNNS